MTDNKIQLRKKKFSAAYIFFLLPQEIQGRIKDFLTSDEIRILTQSKVKKENIPFFQEHILPLFFSRINKPAPKTKIAEYFFSLCFFAGLFSVLAIEKLSFSSPHLIVSVNFFVYAVAGYFLLKRKSLSYWRIRFLSISFQFSLVAFSVFSFALIVFLVGWLSLEAYSAKVSIFIAIQAVLAGPFIEEIFFRDYVYSLFQSNKPLNNVYEDMPAVFISSIAFAAAHLGAQEWHFEAAAYVPAGLLLGFLRWMSKSLLYPFVVHSAANAALLWM